MEKSVSIYRPWTRVVYETKHRIRYGVVTAIVYNKEEDCYLHIINPDIYRRLPFKYKELRIADINEQRFY